MEYRGKPAEPMIIDRYLTREVLQPFTAICLALLAIFVTYSLSRFLVDADAGLLQPGEVAQMTILKSIISLDALLPLSLYLAVMTGLGRLYNDSEIYAMRSGGISETRLLRPILVLATVVAIVVAILSGWIRPWAYTQAYAVMAAAEVSAETGRIRAARFYTLDEGQRTVFIEHIAGNGKDLEGIFIRTRKGNDIQVMTAQKGRFNYLAKPGMHQLQLNDAQVFRKVPSGTDFSARFGSFTLWLPAQTPQDPEYRAKSASTGALNASSEPQDKGELQWRLSTAISTFLLAMAAIPLSRCRPRQGRYAKMLMALGIYSVYFILLDVSRSWVEQNIMTSIWWVPGLLALMVFLLYFPVARRKARRLNA